MPSPSAAILNLGNDQNYTPRVAQAVVTRAPIICDEFTNPVASSSTILQAATATVASVVTTTSFLAGGVAALAAYPRRIVFTTAGVTPADAPATAVVTGRDVNGDVQSETVTLAQTATTASTVKYYSSLTSIAYPAADGTAATIAIGIGSGFGLSSKARVRAGGVAVIQEIAAGSLVTNGTFQDPTNAPPNGGYTPNTAANGSNDYAVYYEAAES